jgi:hypothetical protein
MIAPHLWIDCPSAQVPAEFSAIARGPAERERHYPAADRVGGRDACRARALLAHALAVHSGRSRVGAMVFALALALVAWAIATALRSSLDLMPERQRFRRVESGRPTSA